MCGIAGFFNLGSWGMPTEANSTLLEMAGAIRSRGPDDMGVWTDQEAGIGLAHRRLAIVDLSPAGHQPMHSPSGRYAVVYNGEIYNHGKVRKQLEENGQAPAWKGHSDTETLVAALDSWGIRETIRQCVGMFALAIWDRRERALTLVRDRLGEKPLYYGLTGGPNAKSVVFGSELKALREHPEFEAHINRDAICLLMRHNYIPAPYSIYQNVYKLPPGCSITFSATHKKHSFEPEKYWDASEAAIAGQRNLRNGTESELISELEEILRDTVAQQMMADVPLGAFLSGGVDSSVIVAMMQSLSSRPIKTFTIGFDEAGYDEAIYAKQVARHLGTDHTELYVTSDQAMSVIPELPTVYDEPFSDSSQIPTLLVSKLARQHVTVSLSGDGGDELFGGYTRYTAAAHSWKKLSSIPRTIRQIGAGAVRQVSPERWDRFADLLPSRYHGQRLGDRAHKAAGVLASETIDDLYLGLVSHWDSPSSLVLGGHEPPTELTRITDRQRSLPDVQRMMLLDTISYLPDDILAKVDRAAMSVGLETRVPFLDHRLVEYVWSLPQDMKLRSQTGKWILKQVLYKHVPQEMIDRPKMGFGVPLDRWLRVELRDWAEDLLSEARLQREGFFNTSLIRKKWAEHLSGKRNWAYHLWDVLMFQSWHASQNA